MPDSGFSYLRSGAEREADAKAETPDKPAVKEEKPPAKAKTTQKQPRDT